MASGKKQEQPQESAVKVPEKVKSFARQVWNSGQAAEVWGMVGAHLLTITCDNGAESVTWEMDSGDWVMVRLSDFAEIVGRGHDGGAVMIEKEAA